MSGEYGDDQTGLTISLDHPPPGDRVVRHHNWWAAPPPMMARSFFVLDPAPVSQAGKAEWHLFWEGVDGFLCKTEYVLYPVAKPALSLESGLCELPRTL